MTKGNALSLTEVPLLYPDLGKVEKLRDKYSPQRKTTRQEDKNDILKPPVRSGPTKAYETFATTPQRLNQKFHESLQKANSSSLSRVNESSLARKYNNNNGVSPVRNTTDLGFLSERRPSSSSSSNESNGFVSPTRKNNLLVKPKTQLDVNNIIKFVTIKENERKRQLQADSSGSPKKAKLSPKKVSFNEAVEYNDTFTTTDLKSEEDDQIENEVNESEANKTINEIPPTEHLKEEEIADTSLSRWDVNLEKTIADNFSVYDKAVEWIHEGDKIFHQKEDESSTSELSLRETLDALKSSVDNTSTRSEDVDVKFGKMVDVLVKFETKVNKNFKRMCHSIEGLNDNLQNLDKKMDLILEHLATGGK